MTSEEMIWVVLAIVAVAAVVFAAVAMWRNKRVQRRRHLEQRFGPEYHRLMQEHGNAELVHRELEARAKRVQKLNIKPLSDAERRSFSEAWHQAQERFVDTPLLAVRSAHDLVQQVMRSRGYPVDDFEQRVADLSVDHPAVVEHYRAAHALTDRQGGEGNTEELRQAMVHYRALFSDLLGTKPDAEPASRRMSPAHA